MAKIGTTYVTNVYGYDFHDFLMEGLPYLRANPDHVVANPDKLAFLMKASHRNLDYSKTSLEAKFSPRGREVRNHQLRYGRGFDFPGGQLDLFIPEDSDLIYIIQKTENGEHQIQFSKHQHNEEKERIIDGTEYLLFRQSELPIHLLAALIQDPNVLSMGSVLTASIGNFEKE